MDRDTNESAIRWLHRRPMRKEGINATGTGDLDNRKLQEQEINNEKENVEKRESWNNTICYNIREEKNGSVEAKRMERKKFGKCTKIRMRVRRKTKPYTGFGRS